MKDLIIKSIVKGRFISVERSISTKGVDEKLYLKSSLRGHITNTQVYSGIRVCNYEELAEVKAERAEGKERQRPTWWHWVVYPYIVEHNTKGTQYLMVKTCKKTRCKSEYFVDGMKTLKSSLGEHFKASSNKELGRCVFIPIDEIVAINKRVLK